MIFVKENAVGIDVVINDIQIAVSNSLQWVNYNAYHRIYKNETSTGIKPEWYEDITQRTKGEYEEVYLDDKLDATSFIYTEDTIPSVDLGRLFGTTLSMVFQVDLSKVEGVKDTRNDEEVHRLAIEAINSSTYGKVASIVTGISSVYTEFDTSQIQWDDMQPFHCFRIDIDVNYDYNCCTDCNQINPVMGNNVVMF